MNKSKPSLFVKDLARHLFGKEILLESTVTGKLSNRSKNMGDHGKSDPKPLDPTLLSSLRGNFFTRTNFTKSSKY